MGTRERQETAIEAAATGSNIEGGAVSPVGGWHVRGNPTGSGNAGRGLPGISDPARGW